MEADISETKSETSELKKVSSKASKKMDVLEKDVRALKGSVDQMQKTVRDIIIIFSLSVQCKDSECCADRLHIIIPKSGLCTYLTHEFVFNPKAKLPITMGTRLFQAHNPRLLYIPLLTCKTSR